MTKSRNCQETEPDSAAKPAMEVKGSHRALLSRQSSRKQVATYSTVVVDLESSRKKVSFEPRADAEGKTKKPSMVITLPVKSEKLATRGTQTDFRESEAQTFPWKHEIEAGGKMLSELLSLDWFSLEKNFPPGVEEVRLIEKARQKLAWENVVERLRGKENEAVRKALVLRMTANETASREAKKEEENRERLETSKRLMTEAKTTFQEKLGTRLRRSYARRKMENREKVDYGYHQLARKIRKAKRAKGRPEAKRDIIEMHRDRSSDLYAPKLRNGENPSLGHEVIDIRCRYLKRFHGLEILEKHMDDILQAKFSKSAYEVLNSKSKEFDLPSRKLTEKAEQPKEKKIASLSLKIAVPAVAPEASRRTGHSDRDELFRESQEVEFQNGASTKGSLI